MQTLPKVSFKEGHKKTNFSRICVFVSN